MKLAKLKCIKDMIVHGRNSDGSPDVCFNESCEYLFCLDEKKQEIFTLNDVKEVHFLKLFDTFTIEYFEVMKIENCELFNLDELTLKRMKKLYKERYNYIEEE